MATETIQSSSALPEVHTTSDNRVTIKSMMDYASNLLVKLKGHKDRNVDLSEHAQDIEEFNRWLDATKESNTHGFEGIVSPFGANLKHVNIRQFISEVESILQTDLSKDAKDHLQTIHRTATDAISQVEKSRFGPNVSCEVAALFSKLDSYNNEKILGLVSKGELLTEVMNRSRQMADDMRKAKKAAEDKTIDVEEVRSKAQEYDRWLRMRKAEEPELLKNMKSPFEGMEWDNFKADDTYYGTSFEAIIKQIEPCVEKCAEVISYAQNKLPTITMKMNVKQKEYILIAEMFINMMREASRACKTPVRNQRAGG